MNATPMTGPTPAFAPAAAPGPSVPAGPLVGLQVVEICSTIALIAANNDAIFSRLANAMGRPELTSDDRFSTIKGRGRPESMKALDALIADWTRSATAAGLEAILREAQVPNSRTHTIADIFADPHYAARGMIVKVPHERLGHTLQAGVVPKFSRTPGGIRRSGPDVGQDSYAVRQRLGLTDAQITGLRDAGVLGGGDH